MASGLRSTSTWREPYVQPGSYPARRPHRIRTLSVIPNEHIESLRRKLREQVSSDINHGDWVTVIDGPYKALEGRVVGGDGENAFVEIRLRSLYLIATTPFVFLESAREPDTEAGNG